MSEIDPFAGVVPPPLVVLGRASPDFYEALHRDIESGAVTVDIRHSQLLTEQPERRVGLRDLPVRFRGAIESSLAKLAPGLEREIARALLEHKLERGGGRLTRESELEQLRVRLRIRPDRFRSIWERIRCVLPLRFCAGAIEWPDVDNGRAWSERVHAKRVASGHLGAATQRLGRAVRGWLGAGEGDAAVTAEFRAAYCAVEGAQAYCLALGMRVADDLADRTFDAVRKRLAQDPYKMAHRRLAAAAAVLGIDEQRVRQVWQDLRARRDLALRHAYGVLHFNALRLALLGQMEPWAWPRAAERPELLHRGGEPPGAEPERSPPVPPPSAGGEVRI